MKRGIHSFGETASKLRGTMNIQRTLEKSLEKIAKKMICKAKLHSITKKFIIYEVRCVRESKINFYYNDNFVSTISMINSNNMFHSFDWLIWELEKEILSYASRKALDKELEKHNESN